MIPSDPSGPLGVSPMVASFGCYGMFCFFCSTLTQNHRITKLLIFHLLHIVVNLRCVHPHSGRNVSRSADPQGVPRGCEALQQLVAMIPTFCFTYPGLEHVEEACHGLFQSMESHSMPRFVLIPLWKRSMYPPFWEEANEWVCVSMKVRYIVQIGITDEMLAMAKIQDWHSKTSPTWAVVFDSASERERERER